VARDPVTNTEVWRVPSQGGNGGTLSTGGNLVFRGSGNRLVAHDARTSEEVWADTDDVRARWRAVHIDRGWEHT